MAGAPHHRPLAPTVHTPLHTLPHFAHNLPHVVQAAGNGYSPRAEHVKLILQAGADPELPTDEGQTPLMLAAGLGIAEITKV